MTKILFPGYQSKIKMTRNLCKKQQLKFSIFLEQKLFKVEVRFMFHSVQVFQAIHEAFWCMQKVAFVL